MDRTYFVYILASLSRCLYVGMTNDLVRRVAQHRECVYPRAFTAIYRIRRLVYYEMGRDVRAALARERELKQWRREKRVALIESVNRGWQDLARRWPEIDALG